MKVSRVDLFLVEVPFKRGFRSSGSTADRVVHPVVRLTGSDGEEGWGEAPTPIDPYYVGETPSSAWDILAGYLAPWVVGLDWEHPGVLAGHLARVKGNPLARSAMEMAAWDLWCRAQGVSLAEALGQTVLVAVPPGAPAGSASRGGPERAAGVSARVPPVVLPGSASRVPAGATVGMEDDLRSVLDRVDQCVAEGYRRVKVKIAPGADVEVLSAIRTLHPQLALVADANGAYSLGDPRHKEALFAMDRLGLLAIEQPLADDDLVGHARLQAELSTPVALDEAITSPHLLQAAIALGSCRAVSLKAARLGGLSVALVALGHCRAAGLDAWCGGMHDLGIGRAANLALASMPGFTLPGDMAGSRFYFDDDLVAEPLTVEGGDVPVPAGPGLGVTVVESQVAARATRTAVIG